MANPAEMLKDVLVEEGVGVFNANSGWSIVIGPQVEKVDTLIAVANATPGAAPNPRWRIDYPSVQILVRGGVGDYVASRDKAQEVKDELLGIRSRDVGPDRLVSVTGIGDIVDLPFDMKNRPEHSVNFSLIIEPATGTHRDPL